MSYLYYLESRFDLKDKSKHWKLYFLDNNITETGATPGTNWYKTAVDDGAKQSLPTAHHYRKVTNAGCYAPHMIEGRLGKVATPVESDTYPAEGGENFVTEVLAALETHVAGPPYAVNGSNPIWLAKDLFENYLKDHETEFKKCL